MSGIIDSLLIELGFDTKKITRGQKETDDALDKVGKSGKKTGKDLDKLGADGAAAFRNMAREAVGFFAVLTAGKSLKAFIQDNTTTNVALQNQARNLGVSVRALATWQNVARSVGGTASDVSGSMQSLVSQFQTVSGRQNLGVVFGQMGVRLQDANGHLRSMNQLIPDLAASAQRLSPQLFSALGAQAGMSQGFINMLEHSPAQLEVMYNALQQYAPNAKDAAASQQLLSDWVKLTAQSESLGRTIMTDLTPEVHTLMTELSGWIDKNHVLIGQDIGKYIQNINWKQVGQDIKSIATAVEGVASGVNDIVTDMGGWQHATEVLFALWAGSKFLTVLGNVALLARGIGVLAAAPGAAAVALGASVLSLSGDTANNPAAQIWPAGGGAQNMAENQKGNWYTKAKTPTAGSANVARQTRDYLMKMYGLTKGEADGLVANMMAESGINPTKVGDHGAAYGIGQWHSDRQAEFKRLYGHSIQGSSLAEQIDFYVAEVNGHTNDAGSAKVGGMWSDPRFKALGESQQAQYSAFAESIYGERPAGGGSEALRRANSTGSLIAAMNTAQSSGGSTATNTTHITAPITINAPGGNPDAISQKLSTYFSSLQVQARQNNSGVQ